MKKLWGGRFKKGNDPRFERFSASLKWDVRLLSYDLAVDRAHVRALKRAGVLTGVEEKKLLAAVAGLERDAASGKYRPDPRQEDVHSAVQVELSRRAGALADKIHTGRSRNDLVAQSSRLYAKDRLSKIAWLVSRWQAAVVDRAEEYKDMLVPGMTHLQNAQILSQGHVFLSYAEMLERSKVQLLSAAATADVCVLGSGALAGTTFDLDQALMAKDLGLARVTSNSYDVSGDRDFVLEALAALAQLGVHVSRISEDLMIAQTRGFGLADVDQAFCTGSSMMPQKKNADFVELSRGAAGRFAGNLAGFLATLKGLPTSYNRDLQWDKSFLFDSVETAEEIVVIYADVFKTLRMDRERAKAALRDETLYATDLADHLVRAGVPFKAAHEQVGRIVSFAEENGKAISKIGLDILKSFAPALDAEVYGLFNPERSVRSKRTRGSAHPDRVAEEIRAWKRRLR